MPIITPSLSTDQHHMTLRHVDILAPYGGLICPLSCVVSPGMYGRGAILQHCEPSLGFVIDDGDLTSASHSEKRTTGGIPSEPRADSLAGEILNEVVQVIVDSDGTMKRG